MYIVQLSIETFPQEALYHVWVCADGSCRRCIRRITRGAEVEFELCKLCVCVCVSVCVSVCVGGDVVLCFCLFSCAS